MNSHGLLTCSHYAFPPNSLHYCGPEKQNDLIGYQGEQIADQGLAEIIRDFQTLYPYLTLISQENNIRDPFDPRVVEAYWIGNELLKNVSMRQFYRHFTDSLHLKKRLKRKDFELLTGKFDGGALPHHTFHVLNIFTRTGHHAVEHTLETMDACRIGWGKVVKNTNKSHPEFISGSILVKTKPLIIQNGKLTLGNETSKQVSIAGAQIINHPAERDLASPDKPEILNRYVSFHWNTFCDFLTELQARNLEYYTLRAIHLANQTI